MTPDPRAWRVAIALGLESGLDTPVIIDVDVPRPTSVHCEPLAIPPRLAARLAALEAGHWATEGIRGAVYRAVAGRARIIHTDCAAGVLEPADA